jgi:radical SAM protein with 4Fe4S-binding SPASM domain
MTSRFVKPVNAMQSVFSYLMSSLARIPVICGMPVSVSAELTNNCNLSCPECASGSKTIKRKRGFMNIELYRKLISELSPYLYYINLYFQGEPMMHPQFFSFAGLSRNINTVVSTNGHFLSAENSEKLAVSGLKKLIVSLDGMDQKVYLIYRRNGDFGKVVEGIKNVASEIVRHNSSLKMEIQFLVNKHNEHQIPEAERFAKEIGARLKLKSMQIINSQDAEEWMPEYKKYGRYKKSDGRYIIKSSLPDRCMRLFFNPVITWDGKIIPCCFDKDAEFVMGDLNNETFKSIWNGERYNEFRKKILTGRNKIDICRNCTSGMNIKIVR